MPREKGFLMLRRILLFALVVMVLGLSTPTFAVSEEGGRPAYTSLWESFWNWLGDWFKSTTDPDPPPPSGSEGGSGLDPNGLSQPYPEGGGWLDTTEAEEEQDTGSMVDPDG
jgi:hypothetical protein